MLGGPTQNSHVFMTTGTHSSTGISTKLVTETHYCQIVCQTSVFFFPTSEDNTKVGGFVEKNGLKATGLDKLLCIQHHFIYEC